VVLERSNLPSESVRIASSHCAFKHQAHPVASKVTDAQHISGCAALGVLGGMRCPLSCVPFVLFRSITITVSPCRLS